MIEQIFAIPGIGRYYVTAVTARDYSVVMGLTVLLAIIVIVANMVVDILYGFLDPRTRDAASADGVDPARATDAHRRPDDRAGPPAIGRRRADPADEPLAGRLAPLHPQQGAPSSPARLRPHRLFCLVWPIVSPYDPNEVDFAQRGQSPSLEHPFGTDQFGRDLFTRAALGGRVSMAIGFAATIVILVDRHHLRLDLGLHRRQARQRDDALPRRALRAAVPALRDHHARDRRHGHDIWTMVIALSIASWFTTARIVRGQIITLKENDYVRAAKALGARWYRVLGRHLLRTRSACS